MSALMIVVLVAIFLLIGRSCVGHHSPAHRNRSAGTGIGAGVLILCLVGAFFVVGGTRRAVRVDHATAAREAMLDMQEDIAIETGAALREARRARSRSRSMDEVDRERVKRIIAEAAATVGQEVKELAHNLADVVDGDSNRKVIAAEVPQVPATPQRSAIEKTAEAEKPLAVAPPAPPVAPAIVKAEAEASTPADASSTPRPGWMSQPTGKVGDVFYRVVTVGPHATLAECEQALPAALAAATDEFIDSYLTQGASHVVHLSLPYIQENILKERYEETYDASFGPMKNLHVRLTFDKKVRGHLQRMHHDALAKDRMKEVAVGAGGVLLLLGAMFSYLKLDTMTRGYYTGRLRVATTVVILAAGAAAFSALRHM